MDDQKQIRETLLEILGEEGCGITCEDDADILHDEEGWKLMLCGFMEPWKLANHGRGGQGQLEGVTTPPPR